MIGHEIYLILTKEKGGREHNHSKIITLDNTISKNVKHIVGM